jgi:polyadenylate-binding protein 2
MSEQQDRFKALEDEAKKLKEAHASLEKPFDPAERAESDSRSIYIGSVTNFNKVDYSTTVEDLQSHFQSCGSIKRVTIMCDKQGQPKG